MTDLLPFQRSIVEQMLNEDGLCVMAPGMGLHQIVAVLLRLQDVRRTDPEQKGALLLIGASAWQKQALRQELSRIHHRPDNEAPDSSTPLLAEVTADIPTAERLRLYKTCSNLFVTTRILVVDLLSGRLLASDISSVIVLNAHRINEYSGEGFAVRLYRQNNHTGSLRAFSDAPAAFNSEFAKVDKVLKALHVRKLYLWPRFQVNVQEDLEKAPPELVEISIPSDPAAQLIYEALTELVSDCLKELKRYEHLDIIDLTPSRGLSSSFDETIRRQLASIWHTVSPRTRQVVADLRTLRTLAMYLHKFDSVTFLMYLDTLRATEGTNCAWLFHVAAHTVFEAAKSRVYTLQGGPMDALTGAKSSMRQQQQQQQQQRKRKSTTMESAGPSTSKAPSPPHIEPHLEELRKWHALLEVLEEAQKERKNKERMNEEDATRDAMDTDDHPQETEKDPPIIVFCHDEFTCCQLRRVVGSEGPSGLMRNLYRDYLQYKVDSTLLQHRHKNRNNNNAVILGNTNTNTNNTINNVPSRMMMGGYIPGEEAALAKEAKCVGVSKHKSGGTRAIVDGGDDAPAMPSTGGGIVDNSLQPEEKKKKNTNKKNMGVSTVKGKRGAGTGSRRNNNNNNNSAIAVATAAAVAFNRHTPAISTTTDTTTTTTDNSNNNNNAIAHENILFIALDSHGALPLWEYSPKYVVVYDPDVALTRALEVYKAQHPSHPLRVYLLRYEESPEMDKYQSAVARERTAFENLIKGKGIMALPTAMMGPGSGLTLALPPDNNNRVEALPSTSLDSLHEDASITIATNALTRRAGGRLGALNSKNREKTKLLVDVREFMSSLPSALHAQGFTLIPLTLEVGDYVLSPEIVVERKTLPDLRGSLNSGRLYQQAESMCRYYRIAILLIEFDGDRAFALQSSSELGDDIQAFSLMSRLTLLCLHHPRLRLVWSRSLHDTADIFKQLKANHEEPDAAVAAMVGLNAEDGATGAAAAGETVVNSAAIDVLRKLPGVTDASWRALMREGGSLAGIASLSLERLTSVMGGEVSAKKLYEFLHQECRALFKAL